MTFGETVEALKSGQIATRAVWHGDILIFLERPKSGKMDESHPLIGLVGPDGMATYAPFFVRRSHRDLSPWVPSAVDILADDWSLVVM